MRPLAEELLDGRRDLGRPSGSGRFAEARAPVAAEAVQPAADRFVRLASDGGDLLGGIALMGEQNHLGTQAVVRATGSAQ